MPLSVNGEPGNTSFRVVVQSCVVESVLLLSFLFGVSADHSDRGLKADQAYRNLLDDSRAVLNFPGGRTDFRTHSRGREDSVGL